MTRPLVFWLEDDSRPADRLCRADMPARALGGRVRIVGSVPLEQEHAEGGAAVFRTPKTEIALRAMRRARQLGARVVLDVDDYWLGARMRRLLALVRAPLEISPDGLAAVLVQIRREQDLFTEALQLADAVTVSTPALAEAYREHARRVYVVPNALDADDWEPAPPTADGAFRIGFAGSTSHADDLWLIRDALQWASAQDGTEVVFAGWNPQDVTTSADLEEIVKLLQRTYGLGAHRQEAVREVREILERQERAWSFPLTVVPWTDEIATYYANLSRLDVGLCPLDDAGPFAPWRSDLKPLELLAAGALPIVSRCRAYAGWEDRLPVADGPEQFLQLVQWAIGNRGEVRERAAALRADVLETRTIQANRWRWEEALAPGHVRTSV